MKKWIICTLAADVFDTKEEAIEQAKRRVVAASNKESKDFYVMETVAVVKLPIPNVEVTEIK